MKIETNKIRNSVTHATKFTRFDLDTENGVLKQIAYAIGSLMTSEGEDKHLLVYGITFSNDVQEKIKTFYFYKDLSSALQISNDGFELFGLDVEFEHEGVKLKLSPNSFMLHARNGDNK